jgi:predicted metal-dependent hydrolase
MKPLLSSHFIDLGELRLPIQIKKHRTSRRLIVRYQPLQQSLSLTLPQATSIKQGLHFINDKREWILRQVMQYSNATSFSDGQTIPVLGKSFRLEHVGGRGLVSETNDSLQVHGDAEFMARRVRNWLTQKLKSEIILLTQNFSTMLNVKVGSITLRDTSSRWGSCSYDGNLSFSWRLIFAPHEVMRYVVAHEVAHICEHNHSPEFWKLVEQLHPEFKAAQNWLKRNGKFLYLYDAN